MSVGEFTVSNIHMDEDKREEEGSKKKGTAVDMVKLTADIGVQLGLAKQVRGWPRSWDRLSAAGCANALAPMRICSCHAARITSLTSRTSWLAYYRRMRTLLPPHFTTGQGARGCGGVAELGKIQPTGGGHHSHQGQLRCGAGCVFPGQTVEAPGREHCAAGQAAFAAQTGTLCCTAYLLSLPSAHTRRAASSQRLMSFTACH